MGENEYVNDLEKEREGYLLRNPNNGVEVTCTERFLELWKKRGFEDVFKGKVRLVSGEGDEV